MSMCARDESASRTRSKLNLTRIQSPLTASYRTLSENSTLIAHSVIPSPGDVSSRISNGDSIVKEKRPQKRRKFNVDSRWLDSDEGLSRKSLKDQ
jgi:hypothetical protein